MEALLPSRVFRFRPCPSLPRPYVPCEWHFWTCVSSGLHSHSGPRSGHVENALCAVGLPWGKAWRVYSTVPLTCTGTGRPRAHQAKRRERVSQAEAWRPSAQVSQNQRKLRGPHRAQISEQGLVGAFSLVTGNLKWHQRTHWSTARIEI